MVKYYRLSLEDDEYKDLVEDIIHKTIAKYFSFKKRILIGVAILLASFVALLAPILFLHKLILFANIMLVGIGILVSAIYGGVKIACLRRVYYPILGIPIPLDKRSIVLYDLYGKANVVSLKSINTSYLSRVNKLKENVNSLYLDVSKVFVETGYSNNGIVVSDTKIFTRFEEQVVNKLTSINEHVTEPEVDEVKIVLFKPLTKRLSYEVLKHVPGEKVSEKHLLTLKHSQVVDVVEKISSIYSRINGLGKVFNDISELINSINNYFEDYYTWIEETFTRHRKLLSSSIEEYFIHICPLCMVTRTDYGIYEYPWIAIENMVSDEYIGRCLVCGKRYGVSETLYAPKIARLLISVWRKLYRLEVKQKLDHLIDYVSSKNNYLINQVLSTINYFCLDEERHIYRELGGSIDHSVYNVIRNCLDEILSEYANGVKKEKNRVPIPLKYLGTWIITDKLKACEKYKTDICWYYTMLKNAIRENDFITLKKIIEGDVEKTGELYTSTTYSYSIEKEKHVSGGYCSKISELNIDVSVRTNLINRISRLRRHLKKIIDGVLETINTINEDVLDDLRQDLFWLTKYNKWVEHVKQTENTPYIINKLYTQDTSVTTLRRDFSNVITQIVDKINSVKQSIKDIKEYNTSILNEYSLETNTVNEESIVFLIPSYKVAILYISLGRGNTEHVENIVHVHTNIPGDERNYLVDPRVIEKYIDEFLGDPSVWCIDEELVSKINETLDSASEYSLLQKLFFKYVLLRSYKKMLCRSDQG